MSYYGAGLGQTPELVTLAPHSAEIIGIQTALMFQVPDMGLSRPDGIISASSPTLRGIAQWATANGFSSTGTARASNGGLVIPRPLMEAITRATPSAPTGSAKTTAPPSAALPDVSLTSSAPRAWMPWAAAAAAAALLVGGYAYTSR